MSIATTGYKYVSDLSVPTMAYKMNNFSWMKDDLVDMQDGFADKDYEDVARNRDVMVEQIINTYKHNGVEIDEDEARAMVDYQFSIVNGGVSFQDQIKTNTAEADSFWNNVPIVNCFFDNTTEEDVYQIMNGEKPDVKTTGQEVVQTVGCVGGGALIGGIIGGPAGAAIGAGIGAGVDFLINIFS